MSLATAHDRSWYAGLLPQIFCVGVILAVLPSLLAVALLLPWSFGSGRPGPALLSLGALVMLSPLVNRALGDAAGDFLRLRLHPSIGLGTLTIVVELLAPRVL